MTPVISPWVFYLMSVIDSIDAFMFTMSFICVILVVLFIVLYFVEADSYADEDDLKRIAKNIKKSAVVFSLFAMTTCLIPSSDTITKMLIAQNVTYERVEVVGDTVETVYNDIMALFEDKGETE